MKKIILLLCALTLLTATQAQTLLEEGFDNGIPETWTIFDDEHTPQNHDLTQPWTLSDRYGNPAPAVLSASWFTVNVQADRWLVTDSIYIPDSGYVFSVEAAAYELAYADGFAVRASLNGRASRSSFDGYYLINVSACTGTLEAYTAPLDAYIGHWVHFAIIQNSFSKNFLIVDNVKIYKPERDALALTEVQIPSNTPLLSTLQPKVTIWNSGLNTLSNFQIDYTVDGDTVHTEFPCIEIFPEGTYQFTLNPYVLESEGNKAIHFHAYLPNGVIDNEEDNMIDTTLFVFNQDLVASHNALVEEFSDVEGGYCVSNHRRVCEAVEANGQSIQLVHHATGDNLTVSGSQELFNLYADSGSVVPLVMVDRHAWSYNDLLFSPSSSYSVTSSIEASQEQPCFSAVTLNFLQYDDANRQVSGTVLGRISHPDQRHNPRLVLYLVEDSLYIWQNDYESGTAQYNYHVDFRPLGVVRKAITDPMGAPLTLDSAGNFTYPMQSAIPAYYRAWRCKVVAVLYSHDSNDVRQSQVLNSNETAHFQSPYVDIQETTSDLSLTLYPNPTPDEVVLTSDSEITGLTLYDAVGHPLQRHSAPMGSHVTLHLSALPAGCYFLEVITPEGSTTKKIVKQ